MRMQVAQHYNYDNDPGNAPEAFERLPAAAQAALRLWVRLTLEPARFGAERGKWQIAYTLKHCAERATGWYVSNGEMKGALLAEGYRDYPLNDRDGVNWTFAVRRRCRHHAGGRDYVFLCPLAHVRAWPQSASVAFPALCAATPAEIAEFEQLCARARVAFRPQSA